MPNPLPNSFSDRPQAILTNSPSEFYSVHTSQAALQAGERRLAKINAQLQQQGRL